MGFMKEKHDKIEYKSLKVKRNAHSIEAKMSFTEKEWNKYKKQFENSLKTNKTPRKHL